MKIVRAIIAIPRYSTALFPFGLTLHNSPNPMTKCWYSDNPRAKPSGFFSKSWICSAVGSFFSFGNAYKSLHNTYFPSSRLIYIEFKNFSNDDFVR